MSQRGVIHRGLESEAGVGVALRLSSFPPPLGTDPGLVSELQRNLLDCVIRLDEKQESWMLEMLFACCPVACARDRNKAGAKRVYFTYSRASHGREAGAEPTVVQRMLDDWCSVCRLYEHAVDLMAYVKGLGLTFRCSDEVMVSRHSSATRGTKRSTTLAAIELNWRRGCVGGPCTSLR